MANDGKIPFTRRQVAPDHAERIRASVRTVKTKPTNSAATRLAGPADADAFLAFLQDPAIHAPIYTLPRPLTHSSVEQFIENHQRARALGEGLLFLDCGEDGAIHGYSDFCIWPQWAAGELGGAMHPSQQGQRRGVQGARASFTWMFETLGLDLICETAAPDNVRTARLLDGLGFRRVGETTSHRPDGTTRQSLVWEVSREAWQAGQQVGGPRQDDQRH